MPGNIVVFIKQEAGADPEGGGGGARPPFMRQIH